MMTPEEMIKILWAHPSPANKVLIATYETLIEDREFAIKNSIPPDIAAANFKISVVLKIMRGTCLMIKQEEK